MDNVAHSLAGMAIAKFGKKKVPERALRPLFWTGVIASNLPDGDIITSAIFEGGKLTYLMHHRGHTHTFIIAIPLGLLVGWLACLWARRRSDQTVPKLPFFVVSLCSILLHLMMDFWNIYGVHLLWPFQNDWQYGDAVFIIEPLLWLALIPYAWHHWPHLGVRIFLGLVTAFALTLVTIFQTPMVLLAALLWFAGVGLAEWKVPRLNMGVVAPLLLVVGLFIGSGTVKQKIAREVKSLTPGSLVVDVAVNPAPANPFCWRFFAQMEAGDRLHTLVGTASLSQVFANPETCFPSYGSGRTMTLSPVLDREGDDFSHLGVYTLSRTVGEEIKQSCLVRSFLQFARIPFWKKMGSVVAVGDARFDNEPEEGFSEMRLDTRMGCDHLVPVPWNPPFKALTGG